MATHAVTTSVPQFPASPVINNHLPFNPGLSVAIPPYQPGLPLTTPPPNPGLPVTPLPCPGFPVTTSAHPPGVSVKSPCPPHFSPSATVKVAKSQAPSSSLDLDPDSQLECPVCRKLVLPRLMANHAKYFHVDSELGVECPKCESEFLASRIFSHLVNSHNV